jgi:hypothetical protein
MDLRLNSSARDSLDAGEYAARALARRRELDHLHRNRVRPSAVTRALGLPFIRRWLRGRFMQPRRVLAERVAHPAGNTLAIAFVGHATVQLVTREARLLTDPLLTPGYLGLRRDAEPGLHPEDRAAVSAVLLTHAHRDRLHPASLRTLARSITVVAPPDCAARLTQLGFADTVALGSARAPPGECDPRRGRA